jgi:hypothetical protein
VPVHVNCKRKAWMAWTSLQGSDCISMCCQWLVDATMRDSAVSPLVAHASAAVSFPLLLGRFAGARQAEAEAKKSRRIQVDKQAQPRDTPNSLDAGIHSIPARHIPKKPPQFYWLHTSFVPLAAAQLWPR